MSEVRPSKGRLYWVFCTLVLLVVTVLAVATRNGRHQAHGDPVRFDELLALLDVDELAAVHAHVGPGGAAHIHATRRDGVALETDGLVGEALVERLRKAGVQVRVSHTPPAGPPPWWQSWLPTGVLLLFFLMVVVFWSRAQKGGQWETMKQSPATLLEPDGEGGIGWDDIAGCEAAKVALQAICSDPSTPRRLLLHGPPGCGKTLLIRALANQDRLPVRIAGGPQFVDLFVGVGAGRMRALFAEAAAATPTVIVLEGFDSIAMRRGTRSANNEGEERVQTLHELLAQLDGLAANAGGVSLVAETNRLDLLDEAALRPGRIDDVIEVGLPDAAARAALLRHGARALPLDPTSVDLHALATATEGASGAELVRLLERAATAAGDGAITGEVLESARAAMVAERAARQPARQSGSDPARRTGER